MLALARVWLNQQPGLNKVLRHLITMVWKGSMVRHLS